ncbi:hypothetical protein WK92_08435 [Burkholderia ubonensis]|uniref:site-specific integrase n=1 Tax=Burkholderia ubonensis TaxID=101571 RepID=UPI0007564FE0|nr:site-specific integrase [Burkholderia ubonensis]KVO91174.1 hypothetical protein WJ81_11400 [Burkholderia ubonensis]KVV53459.1 hypothetical protein WK82_09035 [Burkholderia ubonensis]KVW25595.1 hypothetical protein WK92_08435 [Burkholderia ubonensis]KVZ59668.1 hypothetical protein WL20_19950 [Burkholderia ubonensis]KVZ61622.1 hypothetical protein WL21_26620 [Burkholderia ubonensis]
MSTHLFKRGTRYYFRRRVPQDLIQRLGKKEYTIALNTSDRSVAVTLCHGYDATYDIIFRDEREALRKGEAKAGYWDALPREQLENEEARDAEAWYQESEDMRAEAIAQFVELRLMARLQEMGLRRVGQDVVAQEAAAAIEAARESSSTALMNGPDARNLLALLEIWKKKRNPTQKPIDDMKRTVDRFIKYVGDLSVPAIRKSHVVQFRNAMEDAGAKPTAIPSSLARLHTLFNVAGGEAWITSNPAKGVTVETKKQNAKTRRPPFDTGTLNRIFSSRVYTDHFRPDAGAGDAAYWLPLLGLFTGARVEEMAQLAPSDVFQEEYHTGDGGRSTCWVMTFKNDEDAGQGVKNFSSIRRIPVHPELISRGFIDYTRSKEGSARIFPELRPDRYGVESTYWAQWFIRYLRAECAPSNPKMVFHSFRHTFKDVCRECGIDKSVRDALQGHSEGDSAGNYGGEFYPLRPLVEAMEKYVVHGVTLPPTSK